MNMLAGQAVELQKQGMSPQAIGEALGVSSQQVVSWMGYMGHDLVAYHIDKIAEELLAGAALYPTLLAHGIGLTGGPASRVRTILRERGITWHAADQAGVHKERIRATIDAGQMLCRECDVITPAHDSGLCPMCRGDEEGNDEHKAWLEFEDGWLERNLCVKRG